MEMGLSVQTIKYECMLLKILTNKTLSTTKVRVSKSVNSLHT